MTVLTRDTENFPRPKKALKFLSQLKVMLIIFFGYKDEVHHELVFNGQTVEWEVHLEVLSSLRE